MYKFKREKQISFTDFNQPQGLQMNPNNRWVKKAAMIPWDTIEAEYAKLSTAIARTFLTAAISVFGCPERNSEDQRRMQTARLRRRSPIRIIPTELKLNGSSALQSASSVWVCCLLKEKIQQEHRSY